MHEFKLSGEEKKSFLVLIAVLAIGFVLYNIFIAGLLNDSSSKKQQIEQQNREIALYTAFSAKYGDYANAEQEQQATYAQLLERLPAAADTNKYLKEFYFKAKEMGITINDIQIEKSKKFDKKVNFVPVKISFSGSYYKVLSMLHYIENTKQMVKVTKVSIEGDEKSGNVTFTGVLEIYSRH